MALTPIALAGIGAGLSGAAQVASGIGGAVAARRSFTDADKQRLQQLMRERRLGELGLSQREEAQLRGALGGQVEAAQAATEQAALRGMAGSGGSARDLYIAQQAAAQQSREAQRDVNREVARAETEARAQKQAELRDLMARRAASRSGFAQATLGTLGAAADVAGAAVTARGAEVSAIERARAELGTVDTATLLRQYQGMGASPARPGALSDEFLRGMILGGSK